MRLSVVCLAGLALGACTAPAPLPSTPGGGPMPSSVQTNSGRIITVPTEVSTGAEDVAFPADRVWAALPAVYQELDIEVTSVDPASRTLGNARFTPPRRLAGERLSHYLSCGNTVTAAPAADTYAVRMSLSTQVLPMGDSSRVVTTVEATARSRGGTGGSTVGCTANGRLPDLIARMVRLRAASMAQ